VSFGLVGATGIPWVNKRRARVLFTPWARNHLLGASLPPRSPPLNFVMVDTMIYRKRAPRHPPRQGRSGFFIHEQRRGWAASGLPVLITGPGLPCPSRQRRSLWSPVVVRVMVSDRAISRRPGGGNAVTR